MEGVLIWLQKETGDPKLKIDEKEKKCGRFFLEFDYFFGFSSYVFICGFIKKKSYWPI